MLQIKRKNRFNKSLKKYRNNAKILKELKIVVDILQQKGEIPAKYKDHELKGRFKGIRELHLGYDDLLLYFIRNEADELILIDIGTHSHTLNL